MISSSSSDQTTCGLAVVTSMSCHSSCHINRVAVADPLGALVPHTRRAMRTLTFLAHFPFCQNPLDEEISSLRCRGAPGELLSASFSLKASSPTADVTLTASALMGHSGAIDGGAIDLHIVKCWSQAGIGVYQAAPQLVGELLLKDDRVRLSDGYANRYAHWRHVFRPVRFYVPPDIRLRGPAVTNLDESTSKQIWVFVEHSKRNGRWNV